MSVKNEHDSITMGTVALFNPAIPNRPLCERARKSRPICCGKVIKTANGARKLDRGETMVVFSEAGIRKVISKREYARKPVVQWTPEAEDMI